MNQPMPKHMKNFDDLVKITKHEGIFLHWTVVVTWEGIISEERKRNGIEQVRNHLGKMNVMLIEECSLLKHEDVIDCMRKVRKWCVVQDVKQLLSKLTEEKKGSKSKCCVM